MRHWLIVLGCGVKCYKIEDFERVLNMPTNKVFDSRNSSVSFLDFVDFVDANKKYAFRTILFTLL